MSAKANSSNPLGLSGSGALSHAYIQYPPLRCKLPGSRNLFYDDGTKLLISTTSNQVFTWKTSPFVPHVAPSFDSISEGPVLSIRYSLDLKLLAVQRSNHEVQIWNREMGEASIHKCRSESESILGFFWTDCPRCDIVVVKTSGLDMFCYNFESKSLDLVDTKRLSVSWYVYTHESRLVLIASGMQCKSFTGFQLSSIGIIHLPRFEMAMANSEASNKPVLASEDIHIITVYGRIYCLQVDRVAMLLHSYRFYRDAVIQQGSLPIYSNKIGVSVIDNVLLVHQVDAKVVIIYDIFADLRVPISAPLPLLLRGFSRANSATSQLMSENFDASEASHLSDTEAAIYGDGWSFLVPDVICDRANGLLWKIHLDLEAISASSSEVPSILEFLQRRKLEAQKAKKVCLAIVRTIILERRPVHVVSRAIDVLITSYSQSIRTDNYNNRSKGKASQSDVSNSNAVTNVTIHQATSDSEGNIGVDSKPVNFDSLGSSSSKIDSSYSNSTVAKGTSAGFQSAVQHQIVGPGNTPLNVNAPEQQETQVTSAAVSPDDLYSFVLAPLEEEMAGETSYLLGIILEFLRSVNREKVEVHSNIYVFTVQLLARGERHAELGVYIMNKIIEPSKEVALQLIESGSVNFQTRKLGLDMLRQLSLHHDYVLLLVQDGYYLEALRYARKYQVNTVQPSLFLEAAYASADSQHLAAVLRFFCDYIPGFKNTSDHSTYCRILAEMNSSVTA